ncbi:hypothetical protein C2E25_13005 [Geothermobacter hydrogeniphilus]|uniref:Thioredoxin domain-containing protein n=2 Tax=Geothermobacter hydrogeniphilus TaxID=1969733 RepID=A0A2K2H7N8_9BACT|nr:hypothetical protein C2E25_13005 [Geothermobacter hydrogeniphilus]
MMLQILLLILLIPVNLLAQPIDIGEPFPELPLKAPATDAQRSYLGIGEQDHFRLSDIPSDVVLVEVLNVLCPHCQKQTAPYNRLFEMIEKDPQTRGRVKMLGIAVANSPAQIEDFVTVYDVAYPIIADSDFSLHMAIRGGPTPLSIYVRQAGPGQPGMVAGSHLGEDRDLPPLFAYLKELISMRAADFEGLADPPQPVYPPPLRISESRLRQRIQKGFSRLGRMRELHRLQLPSLDRVYAAMVDGRPLYAAVISRRAICDVCHNVHFLAFFNLEGKLLAFEPLHLTRYGNELWDEQEVEQMRRRVVGGQLGRGWTFDPEVDAVSSATMTSAIIFDSLRRGSKLLEEIRRAETN